MKQLFFICISCLMLVGCTKSIEEEETVKFYASGIDSLTIKDGKGNPVKIQIKGAFGKDSINPIDYWAKDTSQYVQIVEGIFSKLKLTCKFERTFIPYKMSGFSVTDTIDVLTDTILNDVINDTIYGISTYTEGYAANAFGVESNIYKFVNTYLWFDGSKWVVDNKTYLTHLLEEQVNSKGYDIVAGGKLIKQILAEEAE